MRNVFKKTYGVSGLIDWQAQIKAGKATLIVTFTGGGLTSYGVTPAQYTTENLLYQRIIENSKEFGHLIKIVRVSEESEEKKAAVSETPALTAHPEITSKEDAIMFLKQNGAKATHLKDDDSIKKYAAKIGVSFPNLYE
jgi:hypothetical protein